MDVAMDVWVWLKILDHRSRNMVYTYIYINIVYRYSIHVHKDLHTTGKQLSYPRVAFFHGDST